jgi:uncharacterized pyridoxamine 5'-phosphate oxidase family protein
MADVRTDALAFLKRNRTGVLATAGHDNIPHGNVMHYTCDENFNLYIMTLKNTTKYRSIVAHPQVAFVVFNETTPQMLQIEGMASDISTSFEAGSKKDELFEVLNKNTFFAPPITKLDIDEPAVIWIKPTWVRWADYAFGSEGSENVLKEVPLQGQNE